MYEAYAIVLCLLMVIAAVRGMWHALRTSIVLFGNWAVCTIFVLSMTDFYPVTFFAAVDYTSAGILLMMSATRWQRAIVALYAVMLVCHAGYAFSTADEWATYRGYLILSAVGWLQLICLGVWLSHDVVRRCLGSISHRFAASRLSPARLQDEGRGA